MAVRRARGEKESEREEEKKECVCVRERERERERERVMKVFVLMREVWVNKRSCCFLVHTLIVLGEDAHGL